MTSTKALDRRMHGLLLAAAAGLADGPAHAQELTLDVPACRPAAPTVLPDKYHALAKREKDFAWVSKARRGDAAVNGGGWERIEGTGSRDWFSFTRIDIDNDGTCDWYLDTASPLSSAGDRDSINTLYLGGARGWTRIGASSPNNKPDSLGFGKADEQRERYLFGEAPAVIHDAGQHVNYIVTALYSRHQEALFSPGYRILAWDPRARTLRALDKWQPGSKAAEVYAYFKQHGAYVAPLKGERADEAIQRFDEEIETAERERACEATAAEAAERRLSRYLRASCRS